MPFPACSGLPQQCESLRRRLLRNYWSRSLHTGYSDYERGLYFLSVNIYTYYYYRYYGQCVRPVCTQN